MIWRSQVLLFVKKGKKRRCLNWTKVGLKEPDPDGGDLGVVGLNWTKVGLKGCRTGRPERRDSV